VIEVLGGHLVFTAECPKLDIGVENMSQKHPLCLSDLEPGQEATVLQVKALGPVRRRLLEMGFIRGARLKVEKLAPLGDPMELIIKGYHLSLRREEGACILVTLPVVGEAR